MRAQRRDVIRVERFGIYGWQFHANGATIFPSERDEAEAEAERRYGPACPPLESVTTPESADEPYLATCTNEDCGWAGLSTELADEEQCPDCGFPTEPQQLDPPMEASE